mgnify:CR=1 FL=1
MITLPAVNALDTLKEYDTGLACTCGDCTAHVQTWVIISGKGKNQTRRMADESYCPQCGCRWEKGVLTPCANYDDPRTGLRLHPALSDVSVGWMMTEWVFAERWAKWFPGVYLQSAAARPVLEEIDLFVRLRELFPQATFDRLLAIRKGMRPFFCSACGKPVDWRIKTDYAQARAGREAYHHSLDEVL